MPVDPGFEGYLRELCDPIDGVVFRRMFGGVGIFRHGLMFALCTSQGRFCLKADTDTIPTFQAHDCEEWMPHQKGRKPVSMGYWYAPEHMLEEPDEFLVWATKAFEAAARIDQQKPPSQRKLKI